MHRFLTGREEEGVKPVFGLTSSVSLSHIHGAHRIRRKKNRDSCTVLYAHRAILIKTATIGYGRTPEFEVQPSNAPTPAEQIAYALLTPANPLRIACGQEGIDANKTAARVLRPPFVANAARTIEWEKIGMEWKRLMDGGNVAEASTQANAAVGRERGSGSGSRKPGSEGMQKRIEEIKKQVQNHIHSGNGEGTGGLGAKIEEYKKQARERKEQAEENGEENRERGEQYQDVISDMAKLGEFLDKTRDMVDERMKEVKGDEKKLAKARKAYPKIVEQVKRQIEEARDEDGELDHGALFSMIPKEGQEGLKGGIKAGKEGIKKGKGHVGDDEGRDQGIESGKEGTRRGLEEMKKYIGKGGDGHNPEQTLPRKRDAKL